MGIDIEIPILGLELRIRVPATEESLPVVRQAMRSLGETVDADVEALEDAELAVTEACANAITHAYDGEPGDVHVALVQDGRELRASVRDFGRGMPAPGGEPSGERGFGLPLIESIARALEVREVGGTEVAMTFDMGEASTAVDGGAPGIEPAERTLRRLVAVVGAQADLRTDRLTEALLVAELVARHALRRLVGDHVCVHIERRGSEIELRVGPLEPGGADAVVRDSEVAVVGSIVERLSNRLAVEEEALDGVRCEYLVLGVGPAARSV